MAGLFKAENGLYYNVQQLNKLREGEGRSISSASNAVLADADFPIKVTGSSPVAVTIPNDATVAWKGNNVLSIYQSGTGTASFTAGSGVTLRSPSGIPASVQYGFITAIRVGPNEWALA
jgi:hypothetical protein